MRRVVTHSNGMDGMREKVAVGTTPGLLPWAAGSDDLLSPK